MCRESLINYLVTELESKVPRKDIETLVKFGEMGVEHDTIYVEKKAKSTEYDGKYSKPNLPKSIEKHAELIDEKFQNIRICDPAVGSGAFLVGMMQEIVRTRNALTPHIKNKNGRTVYNFKRHAIQNCLYGVDVDPGAVEICKLRLWLSLIVDEEDIKQIKPLPNLDYKIVQGNSLSGFPYIPKGLEKIEELKQEFFEETRPKIKEALRREIDGAIKQLFSNTEKSLGYKVDFDFKIHFSEIFHEKSGFDVVIANPPYVRVQQLSHKDIDYFKNTFDFAFKRLDISLLFFERGLEILNSDGVLTYISSNQFLVAAYGERARLGLLKCGIEKIIDFESLPIFESALTYTSIFIINKKKRQEFFEFTRVRSLADFAENKLRFEKINANNLGSEHWVLSSDSVNKLLNKIREKSILLKDLAESHYGIISGKDEVYILTEDRVREEKIEDDHLLKIILPKNIYKWKLNNPTQYIIYPYRHQNNTTILENEAFISKRSSNLYSYFVKNRRILESRKDSRTSFKGRKDWYGLVRFSSIAIFNKAKIVSPTIVKNNKFALDENGFAFAGGKTVVLTSSKTNLKFLLAVLNSKIAEFYYHNVTPAKAGGYRNYSATFILELPIKKPSISQQKPFINFVNKILAIAKDDDYLQNPAKQAKVREYEKQIDQLVYKLYGLSPEEIKIVEKYER